VEHVFNKDNSSEEYIHDVIFRCLKKLRDKRCKRIGFHCSVIMDDSRTQGAAFVYNTIQQWAARYARKFDWIVIVDIYGDYSKMLNEKQ